MVQQWASHMHQITQEFSLRNFENIALHNVPNNLQPIVWKRFIDGIFVGWTHGEKALQNFHTYLNSLHPTIKFDITYSTREINFLDNIIYFNSHDKLESAVYVKTNRYLCFVTC